MAKFMAPSPSMTKKKFMAPSHSKGRGKRHPVPQHNAGGSKNDRPKKSLPMGC